MPMWSRFPALPSKDEGKHLYIDEEPPGEELVELVAKGWKLVNVLLLPEETDAQRAENIKFMLEGIRVGSIDCDNNKFKFIQLEAQMYGLIGGKQQADDSGKRGHYNINDITSVLNVKSSRVGVVEMPKKATGRPRLPKGVKGNYTMSEKAKKQKEENLAEMQFNNRMRKATK